jgi:choloylglycine hydrolase
MNYTRFLAVVILLAGFGGFSKKADACTRVLHVTKDHQYVITGRNMDWYLRYPTTFWKFPRGVQREGMTKENPLKWRSKYGSIALVQTADGQNATADGMNEKGLVANLLYLTETKYPERDVKKKGLASSIYLQYLLDNFATVAEAVKMIEKDDFQVVPVPIPNSEHLPTMHISLSDANGDSAIIEFLDGKTVIHHSKAYQIMANSPIFEKQLALTAYWDEIGGNTFLPGTRKSPDRFVRAHYYNKMLPAPKDQREAIASVMSIMRNTSSPFGAPDPKKPNISMTMWRVIDDQKNLVMFYESTIAPNVIWIDMKKFDFSEGTVLKKLSAEDDLIGEVNTLFKESKPLEFARP